MRLEAAQYRELAAFAQFGSDLDEETKLKLERGKRLVEILKQGQYNPMNVSEQVLIFFSLTSGHVDDVPVEKVKDFEKGLVENFQDTNQELLNEIEKTGELSDGLAKKIEKQVKNYKSTLDYLIKKEKKEAK